MMSPSLYRQVQCKAGKERTGFLFVFVLVETSFWSEGERKSPP